MKKYYNWVNDKFVEKSDECDFEHWLSYGLNKNQSYSIHPKGFYIFLQKKNVDEYEETDPYAVNINESIFHKARIRNTIFLAKSIYNNNDSFKLLDIGCGKGYITNELFKEFPNAEISAFDYSLSAIDYAFDAFKGIDFIVADAYNLPYAEGYFDVIVCNNIWEHVPDPVHLLNQIKKILKKNGILIISTPSRYRLGNILRKLRGKPIEFMSKMHVTEYSVGQVIEQLAFCEFDTIKIHCESIYRIKTPKGFIIHKIIKPIIAFCVKWSNPQHCLESTCYFLAKKK